MNSIDYKLKQILIEAGYNDFISSITSYKQHESGQGYIVASYEKRFLVFLWPGFAKVQGPDHEWHTVYYNHGLKSPAKEKTCQMLLNQNA